MPKRLSFQLYSARKSMPWEPVVEHIAQCGYTEVEGFGGAYSGTGGAFFDAPEKFRALLDKHGLSMPTSHLFPVELFETDMKRVVDIGRIMGVRQFICPGIAPDQREATPEFWRSFGKRLGAVASTMRTEGFGFGWHNHDFEFAKLKDGSLPLERIFEGGPLLNWEMDIGWTDFGNADPLRWIGTYGDRITAVHVKDNAKPGEDLDQMSQSDVGKGRVDWPAVLAAVAEKTRCTTYVVEHDDPRDYKSFAKNSFDYLSKL